MNPIIRKVVKMKSNTSALSGQLDKQKLREIDVHVRRNSDIVDEMVNELVAKYCKELDHYMKKIDEILCNQEEPVTDDQLDDFALNLPALLYFTSEGLEALGIEEDVAKAIRDDVYNRVREKAEGTVADKDTAAELASQAETIVWIAKNRAYKKIKLRQEAGYEMLNSVKKIISRRMAEYQLSMGDTGGISPWK